MGLISMTARTLAVFILFILTVSASALEKYVIVRQSDFAGEETYSVMTDAEFKELDRELRKEGFMATKAKMMAARAWEEDESNEGVRYPSSAVKRRKAKVVGRTYRSEMEADDKLMEIEERLMEKEAEDEKREEEREEDREEAYKERFTSSKGRGSKAQSALDRQRMNRALTRREEEKLRLEAIAYEREELHDRAREVYEEQIELLKAPPKDEEEEEDEEEDEEEENGDH